jgi:hypothetical protein
MQPVGGHSCGPATFFIEMCGAGRIADPFSVLVTYGCCLDDL